MHIKSALNWLAYIFPVRSCFGFAAFSGHAYLKLLEMDKFPRRIELFHKITACDNRLSTIGSQQNVLRRKTGSFEDS